MVYWGIWIYFSKATPKYCFSYNCKLFGLRAKNEHYPLETSQITVGVDDNGHYVGRTNKRFQGELNHRTVEHKNIKNCTNDEGERNIIRLFKLT